MYELIAKPLEFFYEIWPNYAGAISLLTLSIMVLLLPLTLKGTRSMLAMQKLQPELKKIQNKHRDDRQKMNEEVMKFYKENSINPMSGCLPLLLQMPVFFILYRTLYELIDRQPYGQDMGAAVSRTATEANEGTFAAFGNFAPKHLDAGSALDTALRSTSEMNSFGVNLAESAQQAFSQGVGVAAPYIVMVLGVTATSYYQQRQIAGRNPQAASANPQQAMLMKIMPIFFAFISFTLPAGIVVYFLVSNLFRIAQQGFITRTMYAEEDGAVETTGTEVDTSSTEKPKGLMASLREMSLPNPNQAKDDVRASKSKNGAPAKASGSKSGSGKRATTKAGGAAGRGGTKTATTKAASSGGKAAGPSRQAPNNANRSQKKKKRK